MTSASPDFVELMRAFKDRGVEYLVVGAHALAAHGFVRATKDLDVWVRPSEENARRVYAALVANKRATGRLQDLADLERLGGEDG